MAKKQQHQRLGTVSRWERTLEKKIGGAADVVAKSPLTSGYRRIKKMEDRAKLTGQVLAGVGALGTVGAIAYHMASGQPINPPEFRDSYFHLTKEEYMINENLKYAIDNIALGADQDRTRDLIYTELCDRISERIEAKKASLAQSIFDGTMYSDEE